MAHGVEEELKFMAMPEEPAVGEPLPPKTGDESVLWIAAIIASVLGLAWLDLNEKKHQKT